MLSFCHLEGKQTCETTICMSVDRRQRHLQSLRRYIYIYTYIYIFIYVHIYIYIYKIILALFNDVSDSTLDNRESRGNLREMWVSLFLRVPFLDGFKGKPQGGPTPKMATVPRVPL